MSIAIGVIVVVLVVLAAAWAARHVKHPEQAASHGHDPSRETESDQLYDGVDRPAGPDAEDPVGPAHPPSGA
jgi:hypothetical protein